MALSRFKPYLPAALIALVGLIIAWLFAVTVLRHTRPMGLPLDDSYIYLTYAKQFGRGQPFTYFPGGGYSAGSTSVLWPMLLAPFWTLGARGHALVWVSFWMCGALYSAVAVGCYLLVKKIIHELAGILTAVLVLAIAPFAWCALSGMEVAFASALLVATLLLLYDTPATGRPKKLLIACLAATSLSRPEAMLIVVGIVGVAVVQRLRQRDLRAAALWCTPLIAPVSWLVANKLFAGNLMPNTGVAKSYFYLPGFSWSYWFHALAAQSGKLIVGLFWSSESPFVVPQVAALLWLGGVVRIALWARREQKLLVGALLIFAPLALMFAVIASSGLWNVQNYRYIAPAFPLLAIPMGVALAPLVELITDELFVRVWWGAAIALVAAFAIFDYPRMRADMMLFAQGAMDTNTQVVAIGEYIHKKLPDASIMFHDAGAIAYYGDGRVYDMLGLVTNHQAAIATNGPGARLEFLESLPPERRPTHFAYYPSWLGNSDFFGAMLFETPLHPGFEKRRFVGDANMQVLEANWDHVGTGERPLGEHPGWSLVDRVDIADLESERLHDWHGGLGERATGDPTAKWSLIGREVGPHGLVLDGGRTIRTGTERFTISVDPKKPARLVMRTGGKRTYDFNETLTQPVPIKILDGDRVVASGTLPAPDGLFLEVPFDLPAGVSQIAVAASGPYRVFHWFVLQP